MTRFRSASVPAIIATMTLAVMYFALGFSTSRDSARNERHDDLLVLGTASLERSGANVDGDSLVLGPLPNSGIARASWNISSYEVAHLLNRARACRISVFILGTDLSSTTASAYAEIVLNGSIVRHITFSRARSGFYQPAPGRLFPANVAPHAIDVVPLDRRYGFVVPLNAGACSAGRWTLGVRGRDVSWSIPAVGMSLDYTPEPTAIFGSKALTIVIAFAIVAGTIALLFLVLQQLSTLGVVPLTVASIVVAISALTYDQWDFPLWIRFSELATFGGADPADLWSASPLWAFVPAIFSTVTLGSYLTTGDGSRTITELLLKGGLGVAYCYNAYAIAIRAPRQMRAYLAVTALLLPASLYEIAGGYREPFAAALALCALRHVREKKAFLATFVLCAAASLSETLLPLVFFPAALGLAAPGSLVSRARRCAGLAFFGSALFAAEWSFLIPHDTARAALAFRFGQAHFGGASWAGALSGLGLLPSWLPAGSVWFCAAVFIVAASLPALRLGALARDPGAAPERTFIEVFGIFVAFVAAFFVAFRGVDPNTWYTLVVLTLFYFAMAEPKNPFPILFSSVLALAFYGTVGLGEFVNRAYFWPLDRGLLGILGISRYVFDLMLGALAICLIVSLGTGRRRALFSKSTPWFTTVFFASVGATAIDLYALDFIACAAVAALVVVTLARQLTSRRRITTRLSPNLRASGVSVFAAAGALCGLRSAAAGLAASGAIVVALSYGFGSCDLVLGVGGAGVLAAQRGFGWASVAGWAVLTLAVVAAIVSSALRGSSEHDR